MTHAHGGRIQGIRGTARGLVCAGLLAAVLTGCGAASAPGTAAGDVSGAPAAPGVGASGGSADGGQNDGQDDATVGGDSVNATPAQKEAFANAFCAKVTPSQVASLTSLPVSAVKAGAGTGLGCLYWEQGNALEGATVQVTTWSKDQTPSASNDEARRKDQESRGKRTADVPQLGPRHWIYYDGGGTNEVTLRGPVADDRSMMITISKGRGTPDMLVAAWKVFAPALAG